MINKYTFYSFDRLKEERERMLERILSNQEPNNTDLQEEFIKITHEFRRRCLRDIYRRLK